MKRINSVITKSDLDIYPRSIIKDKIKELSILNQTDSIYSIAYSTTSFINTFMSIYYEQLQIDQLDITEEQRYKMIANIIYIIIPKCYIFSDNGAESKVMMGLKMDKNRPKIVDIVMPITRNTKFRNCILNYVTSALGALEEYSTDTLINDIISNIGIEFEIRNSETDLDAYALRI